MKLKVTPKASLKALQKVGLQERAKVKPRGRTVLLPDHLTSVLIVRDQVGVTVVRIEVGMRATEQTRAPILEEVMAMVRVATIATTIMVPAKGLITRRAAQAGLAPVHLSRIVVAQTKVLEKRIQAEQADRSLSVKTPPKPLGSTKARASPKTILAQRESRLRKPKAKAALKRLLRGITAGSGAIGMTKR